MAATMEEHDPATNLDATLYIISLFCIIPNVFVKLPQIRNVLASKSLKGLSFNGALLETVVYMNGLLYYFSNDFPLMAYAEYVALEIQALLMVLLFIYLEDGLDIVVLPLSAIFFFISGLIGSQSLPGYVIAFLFSLNSPLNLSSKVLHLMTIYRAKNSGSASFTMWLILGLTSVGRIFTTLMVKPDLIVITNFTLSSMMNFIVCCAILYYRPSEKKFE